MLLAPTIPDLETLALMLGTQLVLTLYGAGLRRPFGSVRTVRSAPSWLRETPALVLAGDVAFAAVMVALWVYLFNRLDMVSFVISFFVQICLFSTTSPINAAVGRHRAQHRGVGVLDPPVRRSVVGGGARVLAGHAAAQDRDAVAAADFCAGSVRLVAAQSRSALTGAGKRAQHAFCDGGVVHRGSR